PQSLAPLFGGSFRLTVTGQNFTPATQVQLGGTPLSTTFVSATQLIATVPTGQLTPAEAVSVTAVSPAGTSNAIPVRVIERGDINGDRNVNISDALACARTVGGVSPPAFPLAVGDTNLDDAANLRDRLMLASIALD